MLWSGADVFIHGCRLSFPALQYSRNHLHPQRNRSIMQSLAPTWAPDWPDRHILVLSRELAGPSFPFRAKREARLCLNMSGPRTARRWTVSLGPPALAPFPPGQGLCRISWQMLGLARKAHLHTEKCPQINRALCLGPWSSAGWARFQSRPREISRKPRQEWLRLPWP